LRDVQNRLTWVLCLVAVGMFALVGQLYRLTIEQATDWQVQAEDNMLRSMPILGPRGSIFDRHGRALATSEPAFAAVLTNQESAYVNQILLKLSVLLANGDPARAEEIAETVLRRVAEHRKQERLFEPVVIARKLDNAIVSTFMERRQEFSGVVLITESARNYPGMQLAGSLLGFVGAISSDQLGTPAFPKYYGDEIVGKDGLELFYERELQGKRGQRSVIVNYSGRPMSTPEEQTPDSGHNLYLTLDLELQRVAENALAVQIEWIKTQNDPEAKPIRGALVVQDVRTGAILAMASYPTFNPNLFSNDLTDREWQKLVEDPAQPLKNWAVMAYSPGSTYKMGVGLAALEYGVIGSRAQIECLPVYWRYHQPANWLPYSQGYADVARALAVSCDPYFYEVGYLMGVDRLASYMDQFGFGQQTGIDLPGEQLGLNPTIASYGDRWHDGNILSISIGQGDVLTTPLQLANYTATIANGGVRYRPYLVQEIRSSSGELVRQTEPVVLGQVTASAASLSRIQEGMLMARTTSEGTAHRAFLGFPVTVAAKTGSAETGYFWANALTVAYAPYENPEIAVSVIVEGGAHGSWVSPAARAVMAKYFGVDEVHIPGNPGKSD